MAIKEQKLHWFLKVLIIGLCTIMCIGVTLCAAKSVSANETQKKKVRVGQFPYEGQLQMDSDGNYSGYGFDYLQEIARYTGWQYEFVTTDSWEASLQMLEKGEIDIMGAVMRSPQREKKLDFCNLPMMSGYGVLVTTLDNDTLPYGDFENIDVMHIGTIAGNQMVESFRRYSRTKDLNYKLTYYDTEQDLEKAIDRGEVEGALFTSVLRSPKFRVVAKFGENDSYFAVTKGNRKLLKQLNHAMGQIRFDNPYFNSDLNQKYFDLQAATPVSFSRKEQDYIRNSDPIKCTYNPSAKPISYYDEKSGEAKGIAIDIVGLIHEKTGLDFELIHSNSILNSVDTFKENGAALYLTKTQDFSWAQKNGAQLTKPYLGGYTVKVTDGNEPKKPVVAVYDLIFQNELIKSIIGQASEVKEYQTVSQCLDAVRKGQADTTFVNSTIMSYERDNPKYSNLQSVAIYGYTADTCIAVSDASDPELISILNKALGNISTSQINHIVAGNMREDHLSSLINFIYAHPLETNALVASLLLLIILVVFAFYRDRIKSAKILEKALYTDGLTGYENYAALAKDAPEIIKRKAQKYVLLYMDIHQFKTINDSFGYDAGDRVLKKLSKILADFIENEERFARVYADKFVLLLKDGPPEQLNERLEALSRELKTLSSGEFDLVNFLFSGGIYRLQNEAFDLDMAFDRANYAKGTLKEHFSNTFVFYDDVMRKQVLEEKALESSMLSALENKEFIPFYQPKVNALSGELVGAEALVRWNHEEKGYLAPSEFLPFYEKNGFIVQIDFAIFEAVCKHIKEWTSAGNEMVPVSVNFSRRHMQDEHFAQKLKEIVQHYQVSPSLLEIEITETIALDNVSTAVTFAESLKKCGFTISIDDYGTGYSSISFLQELPLDVLKLDKEFIQSAMNTRKAKDIMSHLVTAMRKNHIHILCEGIETKEQRDFIVSLNCQFVQGYFYAKPMPWDQFMEYMETSQLAGHDYLDFAPIGNFSEKEWANAQGFLGDIMPGWILGCYTEKGYPIFYISPEMLEALGYSETEFYHRAGKFFIDSLHPDDISMVLQAIDQKDLEEYSLKYRFRKADGSYIWIHGTGRKILTEEGKEALLGVCTDVTDLLSLQQEREALIETIPGGVCQTVITEQGLFIENATESFYDVIGHTPEQMKHLDNNLLSIVCDQDLPSVNDILVQALRENSSNCGGIMRIKYADESLHWASVRGTVQSDGERKRITIIGYNIDADMHEKQETQIARTKLNMALTMTDHAIYEYDVATASIYEQNGIYTYFPEDIDLNNIPEDVINRGLIHPEDEGRLQDMYVKINEGSAHAFCEIRVQKKNVEDDGSGYIWVRSILSTIFDEDGVPVKAVGIIEDIDRQKQFEHAFAKEEQYRMAVVASAILAYDVNLTEDTIDRIVGSTRERLLQVRENLKDPNSYTELITTAVGTMIIEEDRERFLNQLGRENLLNLYSHGIIEKEYEYRRLMPDKTELWIAAAIHLIPEQSTGDVLCFISYRDIQNKKMEEALLKDQAERDPLTGVYNRTSGEELIEQFLRNNSGDTLVHGLMMIDADRFKRVNDTYGHKYGDEVLIGISSAIIDTLRESDIVMRIGGDEFIVLVKNLKNSQIAEKIARKICQGISQVGCSADMDFKASVSIGIAIAPEHGSSFMNLYNCADKAMYEAKRRQGDHVVVFSGGGNE